MSLTSMKLSKREAKGDSPVAESRPRFPYGLSINLDDDSLTKLGISTLPEVGAEMLVVGVGIVESVNEHKRQSGSDRNISIQLQKLEVGPLKESTAVGAIDDALKDV